MDLLLASAIAWIDLMNFRYKIKVYKPKIFSMSKTICIDFHRSNYAHLAGFQYASDVGYDMRYRKKVNANDVLNGKVTIDKLCRSINYGDMIENRLKTIINLKEALDHNFRLYKFEPSKYNFKTKIKADYMIVSHHNFDSFIFAIEQI